VPACPCRFCAGPLEPVQEFRFLVETATLDEPAHLSRIRALPSAAGRPLAVCKGCQGRIATHPARFRAALARDAARHEVRAGVLTAVGLLSVGWMVAALFGDV
jgi:hypothetical protein